MKKLYVGCALTLAPESFRKSVGDLKDSLRAEYDMLDFLGLEKGTPHDVYAWDIEHCLASCDIFLAICDLPSIGLGYEMATAVEKLAKPTLAVAHTDSAVGRLFVGIEKEHYRFERYESMDRISALLAEFVRDQASV